MHLLLTEDSADGRAWFFPAINQKRSSLLPPWSPRACGAALIRFRRGLAGISRMRSSGTPHCSRDETEEVSRVWSPGDCGCCHAQEAEGPTSWTWNAFNSFYRDGSSPGSPPAEEGDGETGLLSFLGHHPPTPPNPPSLSSLRCVVTMAILLRLFGKVTFTGEPESFQRWN